MTREFSDEELMLYVDGELSKENVAEIEIFIRDNPQARELVEKFRQTNRLLIQQYNPDLKIPTDEQKEEFFFEVDKRASKMEFPENSKYQSNVLENSKNHKGKGVWGLIAANDNRWMGIAASFLLVAFIGYAFLDKKNSKSDMQFAQIIESLENSGGVFEQAVFYSHGGLPTNQVVSAKVQINPGQTNQPQMQSSDVLRTGDVYQIHVTANQNGKLLVKQSSDGKENILFHKSVRAGESIILPGNQSIYPVLSSDSLQSISVKFDGKPQTTFQYIVDQARDFHEAKVLASFSYEEGFELENKELSSRLVNIFSSDEGLAFLKSFDLSVVRPLDARGSSNEAKDIYKKISPAVVKVRTNEGIGSGLIVSADGVIVTNYHVIKGYNRLGISFRPGSRINPDVSYFARTLVVDQISDLALLKLEKNIPNLEVAGLAFSYNFNDLSIDVGETVYTIGHPLGLDWSLTGGIVSQVRKKFKWKADKTGKNIRVADVIQIDADVEQGNSGGPLINSRGEIIGINSFITKKKQGYNFAVSINHARRLLSEKKDRLFPAPMKVPAKSKSKGIDLNKNGVPDLYLSIKPGGRGKKMVFGVVDRNEDGVVDYIFIDSDGDGKQEARIIPRSVGKKRIYIWYVDTDKDGKPDAVGLDNDGDWKPDSLRPLRGFKKKL